MAADVLPEVEYLFGASLPFGEKERLGASELLGLKDLFGASEDLAENERFEAPELFAPNERFEAPELFAPNERFGPFGFLFAEEGFLVLEAALPVFACLAIILLVYLAKIGRLNYFSYIYGSKS
jgi:hypothetical protein